MQIHFEAITRITRIVLCTLSSTIHIMIMIHKDVLDGCPIEDGFTSAEFSC